MINNPELNPEKPLGHSLIPEDLVVLSQPREIPESAALALGGIGLGDQINEGLTGVIEPKVAQEDPRPVEEEADSTDPISMKEVADLADLISKDPKAILTRRQLRMLYGIDVPTEYATFGDLNDYGVYKYGFKDGVSQRKDVKNEVSRALGIDESRVALSIEEWQNSSKDIVYMWSDLDISSETLAAAGSPKLPEYVSGYLRVSDVESNQNLELPRHVGGTVIINLKSIDRIKMPEFAGHDLCIDNVTHVNSCVLPATVIGAACLRNLTAAKSLVLPKYVKRGVNLDRLKTVEGINLPESGISSLSLRGLTGREGLEDLFSDCSGSIQATVDLSECPKKVKRKLKRIEKKNPDLRVHMGTRVL